LVSSRFLLTVTIGVLATIFMYFGLQDSLTRPSIFHIPLPEADIIKKVTHDFNISAADSAHLKITHVYVNPNGEVFQSNPEFSDIGKNLGKTEIPSTGSHYAWEVKDASNNNEYYLDYADGEIVSVNKSATKS
jgi:hypothetical protein